MDKVELDGVPVNVGDKLYSMLHGWMTVSHIEMDRDYQIGLQLPNGGITFYTANGLFDLDDAPRTLFWDVPTITPPKPPKPPVAKKMVEVADWVIYNKKGNLFDILQGKTAFWICDYLRVRSWLHARVVHDTERMVEQDD